MKVLPIALLLFFFTNAYSKEKYAWQWIKDEYFNYTYLSLVSDYDLPTWAMEFEGPSGLSYSINVNSNIYTVVHSCKPHDCANKNLTVIFNKKDFFVLFNGDNTIILGEPNLETEEHIINIHKKNYKYSDVKNR